MNDKDIQVKDLECYAEAKDNMSQRSRYLGNRYFRISQIQNLKLQEQMKEYILHRGKVLKLGYMQMELAGYNLWCEFVNEVLPEMDSVGNVDPKALEQKCWEWLKKRKTAGCRKIQKNKKNGQFPPFISYVRALSDYFYEPESGDVISIRSLLCYEKADEALRDKCKSIQDRSFDLKQIPSTTLRKQMGEYISYRGKILKLSSIRRELDNYNNFCKVINDLLPELDSLCDITWEKMETICRKWLMKNKRKVMVKRKDPKLEKEWVGNAALILYVRSVFHYFKIGESIGGFEEDIWVLDDLGIDIRQNPIIKANKISFQRIIQPGIRSEVKQVAKIRIRKKALGTIRCDLISVGRFSEWLAEEYPDIDTLAAVDRDIIEDYLFYTNTEASGRKSYASDIAHLKSVFTEASFVLDAPALENLFLDSDRYKKARTIYRSYTESEVDRLNSAILKDMDDQMARAIIVHQLLGTRISETLTIEQDKIRKNIRGKDVLDIYQIKTHKSYTKILSQDILNLLRKSIEYTYERFGKRKYVFVNDNNPDEPMKYKRISDELKRVIIKNDLRDDYMVRFGIGTHIMRHTYARNLTELHVDDVTIAKLLGQSGLSSLKYYRQIRPQKLYEETKAVLDKMNEDIAEILEEWNGEE